MMQYAGRPVCQSACPHKMSHRLLELPAPVKDALLQIPIKLSSFLPAAYPQCKAVKSAKSLLLASPSPPLFHQQNNAYTTAAGPSVMPAETTALNPKRFF